MKYRLMGIERTLDPDRVKIRLIGMKNSEVVKHVFYDLSGNISLEEIINRIVIWSNVKEEDIHIPKHILNALKQKE